MLRAIARQKVSAETGLGFALILSLLIYIGASHKPANLQSFTPLGTFFNVIHSRRNAWGENKSLGDEQVFGERPFLVDPLHLASKASRTGHAKDFLGGVFVAALSPDGFVVFKFDDEIGPWDPYNLPPHRLQVHFHAVATPVNLGGVLEVGEVEIGLEFIIDAGEQIEIKCGGHS